MSESGNGAGHWWIEYETASKRLLWRMLTASLILLVSGVSQLAFVFTGYSGAWTLVFLFVTPAVFAVWAWTWLSHRRLMREWIAESDRRAQQAATGIWTVYR